MYFVLFATCGNSQPTFIIITWRKVDIIHVKLSRKSANLIRASDSSNWQANIARPIVQARFILKMNAFNVRWTYTF